MPSWTGQNTITGRDDLRRVLADLDVTTRAGTNSLARAIKPADQAAPDTSRLLPVVPELRDALPYPGLLRGSTVAAVGSPSLVLTLLAAGMSQGSWAAVAGLPELGLLAAHEDYRIPLDRLALVPDPGPDWPTVAAALIDGVDLLVIRADATEPVVRSLQARAREKGCVLIPVRQWPGADVVLERTSTSWRGLEQGRGRLRRQDATFRVTGRGRAARPKTVALSFPPASIAGEEQQLLLPSLPSGLYDGPYESPWGRAEPEPDLWANIEPNEPPDRWADLERQVRPNRRK